jgi:hypothetical protein
MQFKKASIVNIIQRSIKICSTYKALIYEFEHLRKVALANSYPLTFIEQHISRGLGKYMQLQQQKHKENMPTIGCEKEKIYFELPYIGNATETLKMKLTCIIRKYRPALEPCFYTRSPPAIQTFFKVKDSINKFMQANIVYRIQCQNCNKTYIGKTDRQLIRRLIEHGAPKKLLQQEVINNPQHKTITHVAHVFNENNQIITHIDNINPNNEINQINNPNTDTSRNLQNQYLTLYGRLLEARE